MIGVGAEGAERVRWGGGGGKGLGPGSKGGWGQPSGERRRVGGCWDRVQVQGAGEEGGGGSRGAGDGGQAQGAGTGFGWVEGAGTGVWVGGGGGAGGWGIGCTDRGVGGWRVQAGTGVQGTGGRRHKSVTPIFNALCLLFETRQDPAFPLID